MSAESAGIPYNTGHRPGDQPTKRRVAAIGSRAEGTVAAIEGEPDILDSCDFSTLDDETIAAIYADVAQEDPSFGEDDEEDFLDGQ